MSDDASSAAILTAGYDAFNRRDVDALRSFMVDDFRWIEAEEVPGRKVCESADEFLDYVMGFERLWASFEFEIGELREVGDDTVHATVVGSGIGLSGGDAFELEIHHVWRLAGGRVTRMDAFLDPQDAADAANGPPAA